MEDFLGADRCAFKDNFFLTNLYITFFYHYKNITIKNYPHPTFDFQRKKNNKSYYFCTTE